MSIFISSAQGTALLALHLVFIVAAAPVACGSDASLDMPADLQWTIEGQHVDVWRFEADESGGQLTQEARVALLNGGGSPLRIEQIAWLGGHAHMTLQELGGSTQLPHDLGAGQILNLRVRYAPLPGESSLGEGRLRIVAAGETLTLGFNVRPRGAKGCLDSSELMFINPVASAATHCLRLSNCGGESTLIRAAASSMASGSWSSLETISCSTERSALFGWKVGRAVLART